MEPQSWSIQNRFTYRDLLLFSVYSAFPKAVIGLFITWPFCYLLNTFICLNWLQCSFKNEQEIFVFTSSFLFSGSILVLPAFMLALVFILYKITKNKNFALEVSEIGIKHQVAKHYIEWSVIKNIKVIWGMIIIETKRHSPAAMIPSHIFGNEEEYKRFYADLNYFWEQGR